MWYNTVSIIIYNQTYMKKLTKSHNKKLSGVLAGFAEYLDTDPTLIRVVFLFLTIMTGIIPCVLFYFLATLIMPDPITSHHTKHEPIDKEPNLES